MKKRCGQSMDRISQLPDAVLAKILSSFPTTKGVVATAVLSKQWRFLWKMVPKLTFRYNGGKDIQGFSDSVRRTMLSLEAPYLQSVHLDVSLGVDDRMDGFGELVGIACGLHVRELVLKLFRPCLDMDDLDDMDDCFRYSINLSNCQSLETLKLRGDFGSIALEVPSPVCLKSLKTLHLKDVYYEDDESVVNLFSGCVRLEKLIVTRNSDDGVETFTVDVPSLQELIIEDNVSDDSADYVINSPSLKKLTINAFGYPIGPEIMMTNAPELVEANIWTHGEFLQEESITSVKRLTLSILHLKVPAGSIFNQLEHLQLFTHCLPSWNPLMVMLDNSPNLQVLEILSEHSCEQTWKQPKYAPQSLLHLKTLDWHVKGRRYGEEVANYILRNAKSLENVVLRIDCLYCDGYEDFPEEDRLEVWRDFQGWCPVYCEFEVISI